MHTVEILEQSLDIAKLLGFEIRQEAFGGAGGGACEFKGQKFLFLDLSRNSIEQLEQVLEALRDDPALHTVNLPGALQQLLARRAA